MTCRIRLKLPRTAFTLDVDLELPSAGITGIFGASGSGKTTLLRCVAGLERAQPALIRIGDETWQDDGRGVFVLPWQRGVGYVFQEASLFDHLDVRGNLDYAARRAPATSISRDAVIELLGIGPLLARRPRDLSGGERQRVAIARAVASAPRLLLLDEPLASLDAARRGEILPWLERLRSELRLPMLYVSHSLDEIARLAESVVVLEQGRVSASGSAGEVLARIDASRFFGDEAGALLTGTVVEIDPRWQLARIAFEGGSLWLRDTGLPPGRSVRLRVLARDVSIATEQPHGTSIQNILPCVVLDVAPDAHPSQAMVRLRCGQAVLLARVTARAAHDLALTAGQTVWAQVKSVALVG